MKSFSTPRTLLSNPLGQFPTVRTLGENDPMFMVHSTLSGEHIALTCKVVRKVTERGYKEKGSGGRFKDRHSYYCPVMTGGILIFRFVGVLIALWTALAVFRTAVITHFNPQVEVPRLPCVPPGTSVREMIQSSRTGAIECD